MDRFQTNYNQIERFEKANHSID